MASVGRKLYSLSVIFVCKHSEVFHRCVSPLFGFHRVVEEAEQLSIYRSRLAQQLRLFPLF